MRTMINKPSFLKIALLSLIAVNVVACNSKNKYLLEQELPKKPNIIILYADDLGFGDIGVNGATGVETPNIDYLAKNGVNHTDAHCSAATCTPSRFSLLTGSYAFRNNAAVLPGDAPLIIDTSKGTLPSMLKAEGYSTGVIGKWHLGLGIGEVDWNTRIEPGPNEVGFDYSYLIPATGDRVPCVFIENQKVVKLDADDPIEVDYNNVMNGCPIGTDYPDSLQQSADSQHSQTVINGISRIGYMSGGKQALWKDEDFPYVLTGKAKDYIVKNRYNPFFLYFSFHDIHVPRIANEKFVGSSSMGPRGDAISQMDWCVGEIMEQLKKLNLLENTLIIFTSDNGPILDDGYDDKAKELLGSHKPAGMYRGAKYSIYEAGTRMPTVVFWQGKIESRESSAMLNQVDLYASLAELVGGSVAKEDAPDSQNYLNAWLGKSDLGRDIMLEEAFTLAIRDKNWKYIAPQKRTTPEWLINKQVETGLMNVDQLYNLQEDPSETKNLANVFPEKVDELAKILKQVKVGAKAN